MLPKKHQRTMRAFHNLFMECMEFLLPGWMDCIIEPASCADEEPEFEHYLQSQVRKYSVVRNSKVVFDFNLN